MDLTATIAAAGDAKPLADSPFDGIDLLPALTGKAHMEAERAIFFRRRMVKVRQNENFVRQSAVRKGDWKYLRTYKYLGDGEFSDEFALALYNLKEDIAEGKNLAASHPEKLQTLSDLLDGWEAEMRTSRKERTSRRPTPRSCKR
jgi:arylsulfatase A-like enzyme